MPQQKKDKKRFSRSAPRLINVAVGDLDMLDDTEYDHDKKSSHRSTERDGGTLKNDAILKKGRIVEIKTNYQCVVQVDHELLICSLSGRLKQFKLETSVLAAVGDWVHVNLSDPGHTRIEEFLPRKNSLSRYSEGGYQTEIIVAANVDQIIITASASMPTLKPGLIDRYLCIAAIRGLDAIVCINKIDLIENTQEIKRTCSYYEDCGFPVVYTSIVTGEGLDELKYLLQDKDSIFSGQSGVGKSSLINALQPGLALRVGEVSQFNEKGKHTTTQAILLPWDFGGYLVDTPGLKTISLHRSDKSRIQEVFPGFNDLRSHCRFPDCSHHHEDDCAVKKAVESGDLPFERYESFQRIYESLA